MNQRMRSVMLYNMDILEAEPQMQPVDVIPERMIGFNYSRTKSLRGACVHFFIDDYQFERVWQFPTRYGYLRNAQCVCMPNWSGYVDWPEPLIRWNYYRNAAMGAWWQSQGLTVIPVFQWATESSFDWCFDYLPQGGTYAVCPKGTQNSRDGKERFRVGLEAGLETLKPDRLLVVGKADFDFERYGNLEVIHYEDEQIRRFSR